MSLSDAVEAFVYSAFICNHVFQKCVDKRTSSLKLDVKYVIQLHSHGLSLKGVGNLRLIPIEG